MAGFDNDICYAEGLDLSGGSPVENKLNVDGNLYIGSASTNPVAATLTAGPGIDITNGPGSIMISTQPESKGASNFSLFYSSGTATLKGSDNTDLSSSNPAFVTIPSNVTSGQLIKFSIESNFTFDDADGASSVFAGSLFGFDTGDTTNATQASIPFFLMAAAKSADDTSPTYFISRIPWPSLDSSKLKDAASGNADGMSDIMALETLGANLSDYNGSVCVVLGQFTMDINGSDDWIIRDYAGTSFGINNFNYFNNNVMEKGVYGASASSHFLANGGTAPTISDSTYYYKINAQNNTVVIDMTVTLSGSPAGAVDALMNLPLYGQNSGRTFIGVGTYFDGGASGNVYPIYFRKRTASASAARQMELYKGDGTTAKWQYAEMASGDIITAQFIYRLN